MIRLPFSPVAEFNVETVEELSRVVIPLPVENTMDAPDKRKKTRPVAQRHP
jgi:hypothetical protein